ncbi:hypothetical protein DY000_02025875 [Brassica cretica]|uniref:RIN4 pathogenic type III effector avirulence factor Avr cleavage site domain-containing protein n=1 Tax=Brassica cretica TaxID=69181 RepID=A0ABQ7EMH4_BRACR|nr:hypothetical protein DY000_02025875 [Brassica cretica]
MKEPRVLTSSTGEDTRLIAFTAFAASSFTAGDLNDETPESTVPHRRRIDHTHLHHPLRQKSSPEQPEHLTTGFSWDLRPQLPNKLPTTTTKHNRNITANSTRDQNSKTNSNIRQSEDQSMLEKNEPRLDDSAKENAKPPESKAG